MTGGHPLDIATRLSPVGDGRLSGQTAQDYWNVAGPFGGITAATLLRAVVDDPRRLGSPVALTVNFCAAIAPGAFEVVLTQQRSGKSTQHWSAALQQAGTVAATASVVCGLRRPTWSHASAAPPRVPPPGAMSAIDGRSNWLQRYRFGFVEGAPALDPAPREVPADARSVLWLADAPDRPLDFVSLAAMADAFLLRLLQVRGAFVPVSTVSMTTYFNATDEEMRAQGARPLCGVTDARRFNAGFHDQTIELWGTDGTLLASGVQIVWYKD
ncbi:MAG TPA: thioesterase family protein [Vineibacter sp.]|nr:thioesterase family protein [Vineibacter sp.]